MTDRYNSGHPAHGAYGGPSRSPTFGHPGRTSMPASVGYSSLYAGDMHVMPPPPRPPTAVPRGYATYATPGGVPTTTRTYGVSHDPHPRSVPPASSSQDHVHHRRSTMESTPRPPVIVTTTRGTYRQPSQSPVRHAPRASDSLHAQPAASSRSRSHSTAPAHRGRHYADADDYSRPRERDRERERERERQRERERERERADAALAAREAELRRTARPSVVYPSDPRHGATLVDYGDDGYRYTNAGEMARHDLGLSRPSRSHRRGESLDHGYYRPNVNYNADQRSINVNTSGDLGRNYPMNTSRVYDGPSRGGPPPSTRGFDSIDRDYDAPRNVPPPAPAPPSLIPPRRNDTAAEPREGKRGRPVSLYQDAPPRSSHHEDYYRSREDERLMRETRDRERNRETDSSEAPRFQDDNVTARGFGIRSPQDYGERRDRLPDPRRPEPPRKRNGADGDRDDLDRERHRRNYPDDREDPRRQPRDDLPPGPETDPDRRRRGRPDEASGARERSPNRGESEERSHAGEKIAASVGVAAAAMGLAPSSAADGHSRDRSPKDHHRSPAREAKPRPEVEPMDRPRADETDRYVDRTRDHDRDPPSTSKLEDDRQRQETVHADEGAGGISEADRTRSTKRQPRMSLSFNPNDASDITKLREQLASLDTSAGGRGGEEQDSGVARATAESSRPRPDSPSPPGGWDFDRDHSEGSRGRELTVVESDKTVRVVSPPREKKEERPLKGILKQPSASFPEEDNYPREGVAPHKEDKKAKGVPPGARWTKISRKVVNPEALSIGKERFEVRDDSVIVLRVLSKEEIQAYAIATQQLRERRQERDAGDEDGDYDRYRRSRAYEDDYYDRESRRIEKD